MKALVLSLIVLGSMSTLGACSNQDKPAGEPPALPPAAATPAAPAATTAAAPAATTAAPAAPAPVAAGELPTPEDYEQAALDEINPQNIEQELDKLEKDIAK